MGASIADILSNKEKSQLVLPNINRDSREIGLKL